MDQAGQKRLPADRARRRDLWISRCHPGLRGCKWGLVGDLRNGDRDHRVAWFEFLGLTALVALVASDVSLAGLQAKDAADTLSTAFVGEDSICRWL